MRCFFLCLIILGCCHCSKYQQAEISLTEDELVELLIDMHLAEGGLARIRSDEVDSVRQIYFKSILLKYSLTEDEHTEIMNYVKRDPAFMGEIYDRVYDSLDTRSKRLDEN